MILHYHFRNKLTCNVVMKKAKIMYLLHILRQWCQEQGERDGAISDLLLEEPNEMFSNSNVSLLIAGLIYLFVEEWEHKVMKLPKMPSSQV